METPATIEPSPDRFCDHGTPAGSECGRCAALATLFPTAAELGVPPVNPADGDLSRIRLLDRFSPEGQEELRRRAERKATRERIEGTFPVTTLGSL